MRQHDQLASSKMNSLKFRFPISINRAIFYLICRQNENFFLLTTSLLVFWTSQQMVVRPAIQTQVMCNSTFLLYMFYLLAIVTNNFPTFLIGCIVFFTVSLILSKVPCMLCSFSLLSFKTVLEFMVTSSTSKTYTFLLPIKLTLSLFSSKNRKSLVP